ncbi:heavy metal translocating P-type ATPase [uncultured Duodenibacillus sp.]|uniref:heavy metal translocating P-type ATPase n=1 Tax=uncultured Duodenibacillus sp. TaxID=1980699 RepID=UPI002803A650|nr:heavy metal translocating P-type ATPase [uncultured Duodenibacillus sp.]
MASIQTVTNRTVVLQVPEMDCPVEVGEIEEAFKGNADVVKLACDVMSRQVTMTVKPTLTTDALLAVFKKISMPAEVLSEKAEEAKNRTLSLKVPAMDCPVEVGEIEEAFKGNGDVVKLACDVMNRVVTMTVTEGLTTGQILAAFEKLGMPAEPLEDKPLAAVGGKELKLYVEAMDCPVEVGEIETALKDNPLIADKHFDVVNRTVTLVLTDANADTAGIFAVFKAIGMPAVEVKTAGGASETVLAVENMASDADVKAVLDVIGLDAAVDRKAQTVQFVTDAEHVLGIITRLNEAGWKASVKSTKTDTGIKKDEKLPYARLGTALVLAFGAEALELAGTFPEWAVMVPALIAIVLAGFGTIKKGVLCLVRGVFNMSTLMAVAVTGAACLGAWPEAAMVMTLYEIGEMIESLSMTRARKAIRMLLSVAPNEVEARINGTWTKIPIETAPAGTVYRVEPGERAALDGVVEDGTGSMDESMITGESLPVQKAAGSTVWAGALSLESTLVIRSTAAAKDSMSARIIRAVEEAEQKKAPLQRFVDKFAARYTPTVFVIAVAVAIVGPLVTELPWTTWIYRALVLLVIACPCALVISTPVTIVSALALAARRGVLVKGGVYLEEGRNLKNAALDKTGTITRGEPKFQTLTLIGASDETKVWQQAASLADMSSHPVSRAVSDAAEAKHVETRVVKDFKALPGAGTEGRIDGALLRFTNLKWLESKGLATPEVKAAFEAAHAKGQTAVALSDMFGVMGVFAVADTVKDGAAEAIAAMKRAGITPYLLTGDNSRAAQAIGTSVGIATENIKAELLPEEKLSHIEALEGKAATAMVGDGINDAPALSRARIGFAMGVKGADSAIEAADVALMDDDVGKIAWFKRLSELTHRTMAQNIIFALGVKVCFAIAAMAGVATMWMAVFADTGVTLLVVAWGLRLMRAGAKVDAMTRA